MKQFRTILLGSAVAALLAFSAPLAAQQEPQFHVAENGVATGPFGLQELLALVQNGTLTPQTQVWTNGMDGWVAAGTVPVLEALFVPQPPPLNDGEVVLPQAAYYVDLGGTQGEGPFEGPVLLQMVKDGALTAETLVWTQGMDGWDAAGTVADLAGILAAMNSGPPALPPRNDGPPDLPPEDNLPDIRLPPPPDLSDLPPATGEEPVSNDGGIPTTNPETGGTNNPPQTQGDAALLDQLAVYEREDLGVAAPSTLRSDQFHAPTPNSIPGGQVITTKGLVELRSSGVQHLVFHVLSQNDGIKDALFGLPASQPGNFNDEVQKALGDYFQGATGGNKAMPLVFYCVSRECWNSYNASLRVINLGYTNVLWYRGGLETWERAGFNLEPIQR